MLSFEAADLELLDAELVGCAGDDALLGLSVLDAVPKWTLPAAAGVVGLGALAAFGAWKALLVAVPTIGIAAGGYYLLSKKGSPSVSDEEMERKRTEAIRWASEIDDRQERERLLEEARQRAAKQAREQLELSDKRKAGTVGKPAYEIIKRPDGTMGFYQGGKWYEVKAGQRIMGPYGVYGHFDEQARFIPEGQP